MNVSPVVVRNAGIPLVRTLARTWRFRLEGEGCELARSKTRRRVAFVVWHEALLPLMWLHRNESVSIVVSEARDGQYLADFAAAAGYELLRGSSTRGGAKALLGAVRALENGGTVAMTPDGPRGPRRELKPGILAAASRGGAMLIPVHAEADRAWRLRSWDRFMIPKPFARVRVVYGQPFAVASGADSEAAAMDRLRDSMDSVARKAAWPGQAEIPTA
ncbi:MAG TPA: lysophospholipid acyltransferase family protein [Gemmatimonadales bacterium]|nr:lysophospholipid acyltransferase family protein [Gemmatimonadales bacterium]